MTDTTGHLGTEQADRTFGDRADWELGDVHVVLPAQHISETQWT